MLRQICLVIITVATLVSCKKEIKNESSGSATVAPLMITPEDVLAVRDQAFLAGPVITGTIQPARRADLRAEVSTVVLKVLKENGDSVKQGDVLLRLDETSIREAMQSSEQAARAAELTLEQSERQLQRLKTLRASGMTSTQSLEDAEIRRNNAQSEVVATKSRVVQARQQFKHTSVRAPFDGIVSENKTSAGDTVSVGKELMKVVDPASMRFEGRVSADKIAQVKVGQAVSFNINGYGLQSFAGVVKRIDPAANPVTRQVEVLVDFASGDLPRVSGLYAEGMVATQSRQSISVPEAVIVKNGDTAIVWRIDGKLLRKTPLALGVRDHRRGDIEILSGLRAGDQLIRSPQLSFKDGDPVQAVESAQLHKQLGVTTVAGTDNTAKVGK
ncbi:MAG: hypothetical protein RL748_4107 [Pseudomonadota bacterium]